MLDSQETLCKPHQGTVHTIFMLSKSCTTPSHELEQFVAFVIGGNWGGLRYLMDSISFNAVLNELFPGKAEIRSFHKGLLVLLPLHAFSDDKSKPQCLTETLQLPYGAGTHMHQHCLPKVVFK